MAKDVEVRWEIQDGYVGKSRPQRTFIPRDEWDDCEDEEDRQYLIEDYVQSDFDQKISWFIKGIKE